MRGIADPDSAMAAPVDPPARPPLTRFEDHPLEIFLVGAPVPALAAARHRVHVRVQRLDRGGVHAVRGALHAVVAMARDRLGELVFANCIGFIIHAEFALGDWITGRRCRDWPFMQRAFYYAGVPIVGVIAGYWVAFEILDWKRARDNLFTPGGIAGIVVLSVIISSILGVILSARERAAKAEAAFEAERARVATAERAAALASLKALEAQVEPHFLYNTLAHVESLIDREPATAKRMLARLIVLLRAAAAGGPDNRSTLGEQLEHMRAYLDVLAMRLGPRLHWSVDAPTRSPRGRCRPPSCSRWSRTRSSTASSRRSTAGRLRSSRATRAGGW
jgi:hypothetical protein